jgi:hypothetical protein
LALMRDGGAAGGNAGRFAVQARAIGGLELWLL